MVLGKARGTHRNTGGAKIAQAKKWAGWQLLLQGATGRNMGEANRAAACDVTGGVASLNFDGTELQIF